MSTTQVIIIVVLAAALLTYWIYTLYKKFFTSNLWVYVITRHKNFRVFKDAKIETTESGKRIISFHKPNLMSERLYSAPIDDNYYQSGKIKIYHLYEARPEIFVPAILKKNMNKEQLEAIKGIYTSLDISKNDIETAELKFPTTPELATCFESLNNSAKRFQSGFYEKLKPMVFGILVIAFCALMVILTFQYSKNVIQQDSLVCENLNSQFGKAVSELARNNDLTEAVYSRDPEFNAKLNKTGTTVIEKK